MASSRSRRRRADLEQMRHRALMKEFQQYLDTKGSSRWSAPKRFGPGSRMCWQRQDYTTIVQMGEASPDAVIQEDQALLMYYDNALMRVGE